MTDYSVKRDRWGRPWIAYKDEPLHFPKGKKTPDNAYGAKRISGISGALEDKSNLIQWAQANAVVGLVRSPALLAQVSSLASKYSAPWYADAAKAPLKAIIRDAEKSGGSDEASGLGTAFHEMVEVIESGGELGYIPAEFGPWLDAYRAATRDLEVVDTELFVANDELKAAGSLDQLVRLPDDAVVVADLKTGASNNKYPLGVTVQESVYANSVRYEQETGKREVLHPDLDKTRGLLIHAPIRSGKPDVKVYMLDLVEGYERARLACDVLEKRKMGALKPFDISSLKVG